MRKFLVFNFHFLIFLLLATPTFAQGVDIGSIFAFGDIKSLGQGIQRLVVPTFYVAGVLVLGYFLFGAFKYLTSGGDKEAISSARGRITHAIIGFIMLTLLFIIMEYLTEIPVIGIPNIVGN